jgi:hypothetical protein
MVICQENTGPTQGGPPIGSGCEGLPMIPRRSGRARGCHGAGVRVKARLHPSGGPRILAEMTGRAGDTGQVDPGLDGDNMMPDGKPDKFGTGLDPEILHHVVLVEGDGPGPDRQDSGDLLHRAPLRQQLHDLALPRA